MINLKPPALTLSDLPKTTCRAVPANCYTPEQAKAALERMGVSGDLHYYTNGRGWYVMMVTLHNAKEG